MTDALLAASQAAIAQGSKSFALASRLFAPRERDRAVLLYAWCRHCDDVIDGQALGQGQVDYGGSPAERLAELELQTRAALAGQVTNEPAFAALARVAAETCMPERYPLDLIEGFRIDVEGRPFHSFDDTLRYSYHVAGVVGVMMAIAMGVSPDDRATLDRACDLGIAFQLNNIARDVVEDALNRRRYIPDDWLASERLEPRNFAFPANRRPLARLVTRLVDQAELYEASARHGTAALPTRAAWAVLAAADIYGGIGRKVRDLGTAGLDQRVSTSRGGKLAAVARALPQALSRARKWPSPGPSRAGLWTMP
jgi:phytoene synthase